MKEQHMKNTDITDLKPTKWAPFTENTTTEKIYNILVEEYSEIYSKALIPKGTIDDIVDLLENKPEFKSFKTHHNHEIAKQEAIAIAGLGVIQTILDKYDKPQEGEVVQDIGYNSNHLLVIDTSQRKIVYHEDNIDPHINIQYINMLIDRMAQKEGLNGKAFVEDNPLFNGSTFVGHGDDKIYLRISATHQSVAPNGPTLSIRASRPYLALTPENFSMTAPIKVLQLLNVFVKAHTSIVLSAETGAGKTELQKLLLGFIPFEDRIVLIEDTDEMHLPSIYPDKDIISWVSNAGIKVDDRPINTTRLIEQSLRTNPKWLVIAESRGAEAYELISGARSGHPIITTLHAVSNQAVPSRFIGMAAMEYSFNEEMLEHDILTYINVGIHLTIKVSSSGRKIRYIDQIVEYTPDKEHYPDGTNILFEQHIRNDGYREYWIGQPTERLTGQVYRESDIQLKVESNSKDNLIAEKVYDLKDGKGLWR